jgi:hypothetical protein
VLTAALLPKLNGFELCKKITSGQLGDVRPVVMYSAIYKAEKYRKEAILVAVHRFSRKANTQMAADEGHQDSLFRNPRSGG